MDKEKICIDYESEYKRLQEQMCQRIEEINHEWQNKFENETEKTSEIINKLETENKFYKNIIKSILHIQEE